MTPSVSLLALLLACGGGEPADAPAATTPEPTPAEAPAPEPAAEADHAAMLKALLVKKPEPRCQDVEKLSTDPLGAFRKIVELDEQPPIVAMRAATCMMQLHPREAEADAVAWVGDAEKSTLTTVVLGRLDTMPLESAKKIAAAALAGPHKEMAKLRISRLRTPALKAMATGTP